jgi:tetratricopeptide (TPR) repeat protein
VTFFPHTFFPFPIKSIKKSSFKTWGTKFAFAASSLKNGHLKNDQRMIMNSIQEIDLFFRKISPDKGFIYLVDETAQPVSGLILHLPSQIEPLISKYTLSDLKMLEKRIEFGQKIYQLFAGTPLMEHLKQMVRANQAQQKYTRFVWHCPQNEKIFSNLYLELLHNGQHFIFHDPWLLSGRQSRQQSLAPNQALNSPLRFLLLNLPPSGQRESNEVIRALFPQLSQRLIEIEVFSKPIDEDAAHYIATLQPHIIWYISHQEGESTDFDSFNLARLIKVIPAISALRLLVIEGLEALNDENIFSLTRWEPEFSNLQIPARFILPDVVTPELLSRFIQQIILQQPIDLALRQAKNSINCEPQPETAPPIIYFKSLQAIGKIQAPVQLLTPLRGNEATRVWSYFFKPILTSMRNFELSKIARALFEKNQPAVTIYGAREIGKSELVEQFIIQRHDRFASVLRFQPADYQFPPLLVAKIAGALNLSGKCSADLEHLNLKMAAEKFDWLTSALNRIPTLLIFEDVPADIFTSGKTDLFSNFVRSLLQEILQNSKIIFTQHDPAEISDDFENKMAVLPLGPFLFEQTWEFLLHSEVDEIPHFLLKNVGDGTRLQPLSWQELTTIHTRLAAQPMLLKLLRYSANSLPAAELQQSLLNRSQSEIQEILFQKFRQLLSPDVTDLLLTCACLPRNFGVDQLLFIYKERSANYEIIPEYLDELVHSGLIARNCLRLENHEITSGYQIDPQFAEYLNRHLPDQLQAMRAPIFKKLAAYFENNDSTHPNLAARLKVIEYYFQAGELPQAENSAQDVIRLLLENDHRFLAGKIIEHWLSNHFTLPRNLILSYLDSSGGFVKISDEPPGLSEKLELFLENIPETPNNTACLLNLARQKKNQNDLPGAIKYFSKALESLHDVPEFSEKKQELFIELGNCHYRLDQFQEARQHYEKANFIENNPFVLLQLGNLHFINKEFRATEEYYAEALLLSREQNLTRLTARIEHQIGIFHTDLGNYPEATAHFMESISLSQSNQEPGSYADSLHELANVQYLNGDYQNALTNYEKSFLISAEQGNVNDTAISLHQIGMTYNSLGDPARAIEKLQESLKIADEIGDSAGIFDTNYQLGSIYLSLGNEKNALESFQTCLSLARKNSDARSESDALHEIGYIYATQRNFQEAKEKFAASLEISRRLDDQKRIEGTLFELNQISEKVKYHDETSIFSTQAEELMH